MHSIAETSAITHARHRAVTANDRIQLALGALWIIDGLFQLQPSMFTASFANLVIKGPAAGQPAIVRWPVNPAAATILSAPGTFNFLFVAVQLGIGGALLFRRTARVGIVCSAGWAFVVWYLGEGVGDLLGGGATLWTGAPGAGLLYLMLAVAAWPSRDRPACWLSLGWLVVWLGGAVLQIAAGPDSAIREMALSRISGEPGWLATGDRWLASLASGSGSSLVMWLCAVEALIAFSIFAGATARQVGLVAGSLLALAFGVLGQGLGEYWTGLATDPGTWPVLLLLCYATGAAHPGITRAWRDRLGRAGNRAAVIGTSAVVTTVSIAAVTIAAPGPTTPASLAAERTVAPSGVDIGFCQAMTVHHQQAVYMAQIVLAGKDLSPEVRQIAGGILVNQAREIGLMDGFLYLWDAPLVSSGNAMAWITKDPVFYMGMRARPMRPAPMMGMASQPELNSLAALSGRALDIRFLQLMLRHHLGGIAMALYAARYARVPQVRALARNMVLDQSTEATLMSALLREYGASPLPFPRLLALSRGITELNVTAG